MVREYKYRRTPRQPAGVSGRAGNSQFLGFFFTMTSKHRRATSISDIKNCLTLNRRTHGSSWSDSKGIKMYTTMLVVLGDFVQQPGHMFWMFNVNLWRFEKKTHTNRLMSVQVSWAICQCMICGKFVRGLICWWLKSWQNVLWKRTASSTGIVGCLPTSLAGVRPKERKNGGSNTGIPLKSLQIGCVGPLFFWKKLTFSLRWSMEILVNGSSLHHSHGTEKR